MSDLIERIEVLPLRIKLKKPFVISLGRVDYAENVVVRVETRSGLAGFGECCPFPTINGESLETALAVGGILRNTLIGQDPLDIDRCIGLMDSVIGGIRYGSGGRVEVGEGVGLEARIQVKS